MRRRRAEKALAGHNPYAPLSGVADDENGKEKTKMTKLAKLIAPLTHGADVETIDEQVKACQINSLETAIICIVVENGGPTPGPNELARVYAGLGLQNGSVTLDHVRGMEDDSEPATREAAVGVKKKASAAAV
jgi:hypothetical protein